MKKILIVFILGFINFGLFAQTGPGGVGNSDGTSSQPKNILWLDANYLGLNNDDPVSEWTDRSGNNNNAEQTTTLRQPLFKTSAVNGFPIIYFENDPGAGDEEDFLSYDGNILVNTDLTVFFVGARRNDGENFILAGTTESSNQNMHFGWRNATENTCNHWGNDIYSTLSGDGSGYVGDGTPNDNYGIFMNRLASAEANPQRRAFQDGTQIGSVDNATQLSAYGGSGIARWRATAKYYDVNVAEVIYYTDPLNSAQRIIVENYLAAKYSISIANTYYGGAASGFYYDVAGIGEETDGTQSRSASAGLYIYENTSSLTTGEYVMFGHENVDNSSATKNTGTVVTNAGAQAAWNREWYIDATKVDGIDAKLVFDFKEALTDGEYPQNVANYVLLYRATNGATDYTIVGGLTSGLADADQVYFDVDNANLADGYYTIGTTDDTNSPIEGAPGNTWYTLVSGDWEEPDIWTLDPSGALPNNPGGYTPTTSPSSAADKVVILSGRTVTISAGNDNKIHSGLEVQGRLNLSTTTGHNFGQISGSGRILLHADNFPAGDATEFITAGKDEGTVVYQGESYTLSADREYYNMEIILDNAANTVTLMANYTINGNLIVEKGILKINDDAATDIRTIIVKKDVTVDAEGQIITGQGNTIGTYSISGTMPVGDNYFKIFHQFEIYGNFSNNGAVRFTNQTDPIYNQFTNTGAVTVWFKGAASKDVTLYGTTDFYNLIVDKGTDKTFILKIYSNNANNFNLYGPNNVGRYTSAPYSSADPCVRKALWIYNGTLKLTGYINIPTLSEGNQVSGNGDYAIGTDACLWIADPDINVYSTASDNSTSGNTQVADGSGSSVTTGSSNQAMTLYGKFRISDGVFGTRNSAGFIFWTAANAQVYINGGNVNVAQMRSAGGGSGIASYIQTGGTVLVRGNETEDGEYTGNYPLFGLESEDAVFSMSGGEIILRDEDGDPDPEWYIPCSEGNYNVTGGKVTINVRDTRNFQLFSTANFWDLDIINNTGSGNMTVQLDTNLTVSHDLTINPYAELDVEDTTVTGLYHDVYIGRNFSILEDGTTKNIGIYNYQQNTTTFNGTEDGELYIGWNHNDGHEQYFWNLTVNKTAGKQITVKGDTNKDPDNVTSEYFNRLVHVVNDVNIISGILNQGRQSIRLFEGVTVNKNGQLGTYEVGVTPLTAYIMFRDGDLTINSDDDVVFGNIKFNSTGTVTFTSDVYIKRIGYYQGLYNIATYKLKVDYLHSNATTKNYAFDVNNAKMIYSDANASDGGIELYIPANSLDSIFGIPLGTTADGVTRSTPAEIRIDTDTDDGYIQIRPVDGELKTTNLSGGNLLSYYWRVGHSDFTTLPTVRLRFRYNNHDDDVPDEASFTQGKVLDENPYTRSTPNGWLNTGNNTIGFDPIVLENANYTAGVSGRFTGSVPIFHSNAHTSGGSRGRWTTAADWVENQVPTEGSVVIISANDIIDVRSTEPSTSIPAEVNLTNANSRVQFYANSATYDLGIVKGTGWISFNMVYDPIVNGDFGDFASHNDSKYLFFTTSAGSSYTLNNIPQPAPSVYLESGNYTINQNNLVINYDLRSAWQSRNTIIANDVLIKRNLIISDYDLGSFQFPASGSAVTLTVEGNVTVADSIIVNNPGVASTLEHKFIVGGDITITEDNIYLFSASDRTAVILELSGKTSNSYSNTAGTVPDLYRIIMNKGTNQDSSFTFSNDFNLSGATSGTGVSKALELQNGTLILDDTDIDINLTTGDEDFDIPSSACLQVTQGTVNVYGDNTGINLDGKLLIDGGTVDMINGAGNGNNYIEYSASGNAEIEISSGNLWVGSQIRRSTVTEEGILSFTQSGGDVQFGVNGAGADDRAIFEILNTGSSFTHSAGNFYLVNDHRNNPSIASFYFNPETVNLTTGTSIQFGNASTTAGDADLSLYAGKDLMNIGVNSTNSPSLTLNIVPLTLIEDLTINANSEFDANGLDLNIKGDFTNNGTFTANNNTTYFNGTATQNINGITTTFYNLSKPNSNQLDVNTDIIIENDALFDAGILADNSNEIYVQGDINIDLTHNYGGSGDGITLNGASKQYATGNGTLGKLTINNGNSINMPIGNSYTITNELKLTNGVFDIGKNLLKLEVGADVVAGNPFSETNMISTNMSFTDNGVKKVFTSGASNFIFPMGSENKYTPVSFTITANANSTGAITVKAANERHPSIQEDAEAPDPEIVDIDNVLQYHWVLKSDGISGFTATAKMKYYEGDVEVTAPYTIDDYIPARLLNDGTGMWNKYNTSDVDKINHELDFSFSNKDDSGISGDYTAGVDGSTFNGAIPDQVPFYETNQNGEWTDGSIWTPNVTGGPRGAMVRVNTGHTVTVPNNFISSYTTEINGTLKVDSTFGHRLGNVNGTGTLYSKRESLPAGYYDDFCLPGTGTFEFGGTGSYDILASFTTINNLKISGTNEKRFPNSDLIISGNLIIDGDDANLILNNDHDKTITVGGNITKNLGVFDAGFGVNAKVFMNGSSAQSITGNFTGTSAFYHYELDNTNGLTLNGPVEIDADLTFSNGIINSTAANLLSINNTAENAIVGQASSRYVDGPMRKQILNNGSFTFPVGNDSRYGQVEVISTATTGAQYWETEYFNTNPNPTYDITSVVAPIQTVSNNEYWRVKGPAGDQSHVKIRWDSQSQLPAATDPRSLLHIVEWDGSAWTSVGQDITDNGINDGRIQTDSKVNLDEHVFTIGSEDNTPLSTAGFISNDTTICAGGTASLIIECSGNAYWDVDIHRDGGFVETIQINASPYTYNVTVAGVYSINAVRGDNGTIDGNTFGNDITVAVNPIPTAYNVTDGGAYCAGGSGVAVGLDNSDTGVTYTLYVDGSLSGSTAAGSTGNSINFGNQTVAGNYTVEAQDATGNCTQTMTGSVDVTINPLPTANITVAIDTICNGDFPVININFTTAATDWDLVIDDSTNPVENINILAAENPYDYTPVNNPEWVDDGSPDTDYVYSIQITDSNGCVNTYNSPTITVFKVPETGSQYHIKNDFAN